MAENAVMKAIKERRSIRKYEDKPVPKEVVDELLSAAMMSPSAMNRQPWEFIVVTDRKMIRELSDRVKKQAGIIGYAAKYAERFTSREDLIFYGAPLVVIVTAPKNYEWAGLDCGILAQTMFLAAYSLGLGSCFIGFARMLNKDAEAFKMLGIPADREILAPLIFGYAAEKKEPHEAKPKAVKRI
jgi:nitroreductase